MVGSGGGGTVFIENVESPTEITRLSVPVGATPVPITLNTEAPQGTAKTQAPTNVGVLVEEVVVASGVRTTMATGTLSTPQGRVVLAQSNFLIPETTTTPPVYYREQSASGAVIVATLTATGGVGGYTWTEEGNGELEIVSGNVVRIPSGETATNNGKILVLTVKLADGAGATGNNAALTDDSTLEFTVSYRNIADLSASFNPSVRNVYGLTGEGREIVVATITAAGNQGVFTYAKTGGQLDVRSAGGNGGLGHAVIPANVVPSAGPGTELVLRAELSQPIPGGSSTRTIAFSLTVRYIGVNRISPPAFAAESGKAILVQSPTFYRVTALANDRTAMDIATLNEATGGGNGTKTYAKVGNGGLDFNTGTRKVSIPENTPPTNQRLGLTVRITDSGAGSEVTPDVLVTMEAQYVQVGAIDLNFFRNGARVSDVVVLHGLAGDNAEVANVAEARATGGFGNLTTTKKSGGLGLRNGREVFIPQGNAPTGQNLVLEAGTTDGNDPSNITGEALATMTVRYEEVPALSGEYYPADSNGNGQVRSGANAIGGIHAVGMAAATGQFTVASLSVSGGVGDYQYRQIGGGNLFVDGNGQILMRSGVQPSAPDSGASPFVIVVEVNDRGTNDNVTPPITLTLTVRYNTVVPIEADVVDTRNNNAVIKTDGGTVWFLTTGSNVDTPFGRLNIRGGFGGSYQVEVGNVGGITYNDSTKMLSMVKCSSGTKRIRLTINDVGQGSELTEEPKVLNIELTNQCVAPISAQLRNAADDANATSPLSIYGLESASAATVAAVVDTSGGSGSLVWRNQSGDLELNTATNQNQLWVRSGTTPQTGNGRELIFRAELNDPDANGGFLTPPLGVSVTVRYIVVPGVELDLNRGGNPISDVVRVYGIESVRKSEKIADIVTGGGAAGANVRPELETAGTTPNVFAVSNNELNLDETFPAFDSPKDVIAVVSANDSYNGNDAVILANVAATPAVEKRVTARLLPVRGTVEAGGNIERAARNPNNVVSPTSPSATEGNFTVYVLAGETETGVIARVGAASVADNARLEGVSGLQVNEPTEVSGTGLQFDTSGNNTDVRIVGTAAPTSGGANLNLVLSYNDSGFDEISDLTAPRLKTVNVVYDSVEPFAPRVRNAAGNADLTETATIYALPSDNDEKLAAKLVKFGGEAGTNTLRVIRTSGTRSARLQVKNGDVFVRAGTGKNTTLELAVVLDDADTAEGAVTDPVTLSLTVAYLESRNVAVDVATVNVNNGVFGAVASDGTRTLYLDASAGRSEINVLRLNIRGGVGAPYSVESSGGGLGLSGFSVKPNNAESRFLALSATIGDGDKAYATLRVDDQGNAQTEPALVTATVEVQVVEAIEAKFVNPADNSDLGELRVMSAPTRGAEIHIANISAQKGVGNFRYTKENGSSADLLLDTTSGQVSLAGNYDPDGQNTLTIIVKVEDRGDGSTLTDAVLITLKFVLAETVKANAFLLNNDGKYLPGGSAGADLPLTAVQTIRVKTTEYVTGRIAAGITPTGGLGAPYTATEMGATGLSAENTAVEGEANYPIRVAVDANLQANNAPATLALTAVINDGNDTNNLTEGATITVSVVYDDVDPIAGAFNDMDGNAIAAKHVVVNSSTNAAGPNEIVASIEASGGVGGESGSNYTFSQMGNETGLIVNNEGKILVRQGIQPKASENELTATVRINDSGNWSHVSDAQEITVTVVYSSKVDVALSAFADIRDDADPAQIDPDGGTLVFQGGGRMTI